MTQKENRTAVMHAGSSAGHVIVTSVVVTLLWYCFDDHLATLVSMPALGSLRWTFVLPLTLATSTLLSVAGTNWSAK